MDLPGMLEANRYSDSPAVHPFFDLSCRREEHEGPGCRQLCSRQEICSHVDGQQTNDAGADTIVDLCLRIDL